jgi:hypothetical protein
MFKHTLYKKLANASSAIINNFASYILVGLPVVKVILLKVETINQITSSVSAAF